MTIHDRDFASHRFTLRSLPRLPISGPVAERRTPRSVDVAVVVVCLACALFAWWLA
jgi:hypothetical protein